MLGGFEDDGISGDDGGGGHAGEDRQGEIPGGDHDGRAAGFVEPLVGLAGDIRAGGGRQLSHLAGVIAAEVDGLGDVGIGFAAGFAALGDFDCGEIEAVAAENVGDAIEQARARSVGGTSRQVEKADLAAAMACSA